MKHKFFMLLLGILAAGVFAAENPRELEKRLQKSSPGLPEFRAYTDMFGIVRSVRTLPAGQKAEGSFKLAHLAAYPQISMLDISGVSSIDLTGIEKFKELRYLRLAAPEIKGIEKAVLPELVRLDLSNTNLTDITWLKSCPKVRILNLPESVTNIASLKGRSFRALSIPGVRNSDDVCRTLGIKVAIRTSHAYRRPGRESMPPLALKRDEKGSVTSAAFLGFAPRKRALGGLLGDMFPEELRIPGVPPKPEEYPGVENFSRSVPFKVSVFLKDAATLKKLDLRALGCVVFAGETFPQLEELHLSHAVAGLETLKAPKLKRLILENIEGYLSDSEIPRPPFRGFFTPEARKGVTPVRLGKGWNLDLLKISPRRDEFDFNSLQGITVKALECRYSGTSLGFLKGQKIYRLALYAPNVAGKETAILGTLPLKDLTLTFNQETDAAFLRKLKLRRLVLSGAGKNFSVAMLLKMPLETLRLQNCRSYVNGLKLPKLKELVLDQVIFTQADFLARSPQLRTLALENCVFAPAGLTLREPDLDYVCGDLISKQILKLKHLNTLRIGQIGVFKPGDRIVNYDFPWERFKALQLVNFSLLAERADFAKEYKHLKRLKIDDISRHGISPDQVRVGALLETLVLTNVRSRPDRAVPEPRSRFRRPMIPAPRPEPAVAKKLYTDAPGGFNGGFLH